MDGQEEMKGKTFKFKIWDKRLNQWVTDGINLISQLNNDKEYEVFQFLDLGIKNEDGTVTEVYEGDIVETHYDSVGIVTYIMKPHTFCHYAIVEISPYKRTEFTERSITTIKKVIGHIMEPYDPKILEPKITFYMSKFKTRFDGRPMSDQDLENGVKEFERTPLPEFIEQGLKGLEFTRLAGEILGEQKSAPPMDSATFWKCMDEPPIRDWEPADDDTPWRLSGGE